ncbi:MAG: electron transport complex subunit RsxC, partial [Pseudomonadota bacterium]
MNQLYSFHGGLKLSPNKTLNPAIDAVDIPAQLVVPLLQHQGQPARPIVDIGDKVLTGQLIARVNDFSDNLTPTLPVHAPSSGRISGIESCPIPHVDELHRDCIIIEPDGQDRWTNLNPLGENYIEATPDQLQQIIAEAGIAGLGGAGFPAYVKLRTGQINTLIINGAECEPYISCDLQLMFSRAQQVLEGAVILAQATGSATACLIALEDNQPEVFEIMQAALETLDGQVFSGSTLDKNALQLVQVPAIYPIGGERQLIRVLTGLEIPHKFVPVEQGILVHNIGTAVATYNAVAKGEPLISRVVTVTGDAVRTPKNLEVRFGTPIQALLAACECPEGSVKQLITGGPMMGYPLSNATLPITKTNNCILALANKKT